MSFSAMDGTALWFVLRLSIQFNFFVYPLQGFGLVGCFVKNNKINKSDAQTRKAEA
jgi:hypothetical protein